MAGLARQGVARLGGAWRGVARQAWHSWAGCGTAWLGKDERKVMPGKR